MPVAKQEQLFKAASQLWLNYFGRARAPQLSRRIDKGVARRANAAHQGEEGFKKRHREALDTLADEACQREPQPGCDSWAAVELIPKQQEELGFNAKKIKTAKAEALLSMHLMPEEISPDLVNEAEQLLGRTTKNQHERKVQKTRVKQAVKKPVQDEDARILVWHESGSGELRPRQAWAPQRRDATVFAVADPAQATTDTTIVAGLVGGALSASPGGTVAFRRALAMPRVIHITLNFMQERAQLCADICALLRVLGSKWKMWTEDGQPAAVCKSFRHCCRPLR